MEANRETFLDWLRDAHAAEKQALTMLNGQAGRLEHYPALKARIEQHIRETESQVEVLQQLLSEHDSSASMVKDATGRLMAFAQNIGGMVASDEVVKGAIFSYAFEQMEIASYHVLIATAERIGDSAAATALQGILAQEEDMAGWLAENLTPLVNSYLDRRETDRLASR